MAEVFIGSTVGAEGFSRKVAIKRVLPGFSDNPAFAQMFTDEARISSRLAHPNIVSVIDFDRDAENRLYLVMELIEGKDLDALAGSGPLPVPLIIYIISEVLRGLGHAHDLPYVANDAPMGPNTMRAMRGIVHRDVSPHNVLLSWEGAVKVSDFGIAKARSASEATASVFIKGKPAYMSPEQANGESLDGRSDLFAVGVMMWEMLCGRRLFVGEDTRATLASVLFGQIPRPRTLRSDVPKDVERVVMKLLERDLGARYATAEDAIRDLLECEIAPRDGRDLLRRTLSERFPHEAPVRHSALRARSESRPTPHNVPVHARPTIAADRSGGPAGAPAQSLGAMRSAPTNTMQPSASIPRRRSMVPFVVIGGLVLVIAVVAIIAVATSSGGGGAARSDAGVAVGSAPTPDAAVAVASIDAAAPMTPGDAAIAAPPALPDAAPSQKDASVAPIREAAEKRKGRLQVTAFPALTVYVDKRKIHDTPVTLDLPIGKHTVRLVNKDIGKDESVPVTIKENQTTNIERN